MPKQTTFKSHCGSTNLLRHCFLNFALVVFIGSCYTASFAFTLRNLNTNVRHRNSAVISRKKIFINYPRNAIMEMSSIGQDPDTDDKHDEFTTWMHSNLPDPPEDQISVSFLKNAAFASFLFIYCSQIQTNVFREQRFE
jgi:hypothetical protein